MAEAPDLREFIRRALTPVQTLFLLPDRRRGLVVTDANGGDSSEVEKAQWIEQVEEATAAVEELGPREYKTPAQDLALAVTSSGHCIRCRRKHEFRDFAYAWLHVAEGSVCPSCLTPDEQREMVVARSAV